MKFHIRTLGCKMNWLDSARTAALLQAAGHTPVDSEREAELILVNSCTVTGEADRKSRKAANAANRTGIPIAVMGCGPRVDGAKWEEKLPGATIVRSERELFDRLGIDPAESEMPLSSRTRLPVAIQTGCDNRCTFCITKVARGAHANIPAERIVNHINEAVEHGIREVVLTGINLAAWGCSDSNRAEESRLGELLEQILERTAIPRVRISSMGPQYLNDRFYDVFADERICDHLHISLQSGSPAVLAAMDRGHGVEEMLDLAERSRRVRPDVALTADLIVGFPGEGEREFEETVALAESTALAKLHVFPYSTREGTPAAAMAGQLPAPEKKARAARLREVGRTLRTRFIEGQLGKEKRVLVETNGAGLTGNYIRVRSTAEPGSVVPVTLNAKTLLER